MSYIKKLMWLVAFLIVIPTQVNADGGFNISHLVQWKGTGVPVELPKGVGGKVVPAGTACYEVPMVIPQTGIRIGTGFDCISNSGSLVDTGEGTVTTYYIFVFSGLGSIISQNRVVVRNAADNDAYNPVPTGEDPVNKDLTHILGSFPDDDTIVGGTKRFKKTEGKVRVSGGVSLANFPSEIVFDDLFVIDLER